MINLEISGDLLKIEVLQILAMDFHLYIHTFTEDQNGGFTGLKHYLIMPIFRNQPTIGKLGDVIFVIAVIGQDLPYLFGRGCDKYLSGYARNSVIETGEFDNDLTVQQSCLFC
ncbi:MAG TPA: hypothetical protein VN371_07255 [Chlorobaculum sp.]|nr:hypothetical protein [Chlorobaculum sp.]